jgi:hypothetical protein
LEQHEAPASHPLPDSPHAPPLMLWQVPVPVVPHLPLQHDALLVQVALSFRHAVA